MTLRTDKQKKVNYRVTSLLTNLSIIISDYIEDCFGLLPDLCRRHLKHEDPELVPALTKEFIMLHKYYIFPEREGTLGCLLHYSPKFCNNDFLFVG